MEDAAEQAGLKWPICVHEVSSVPLTFAGVDDLTATISKLAGDLAGDGQLVPTSYLEMESAVDFVSAKLGREGQPPRLYN